MQGSELEVASGSERNVARQVRWRCAANVTEAVPAGAKSMESVKEGEPEFLSTREQEYADTDLTVLEMIQYVVYPWGGYVHNV